MNERHRLKQLVKPTGSHKNMGHDLHLHRELAVEWVGRNRSRETSCNNSDEVFHC